MINYTYTTKTPLHFSMWYPNQPQRKDGLQTMFVTTINCEFCGYQGIHTEHSPVAISRDRLIISSHQDVCEECEHIYYPEYN